MNVSNTIDSKSVLSYLGRPVVDRLLQACVPSAAAASGTSSNKTGVMRRGLITLGVMAGLQQHQLSRLLLAGSQ
jgi:hypothetical protein